MPRSGRAASGRPLLPWRALGTSAGVLGSEGVAGVLHPALGEALATADVVVWLAVVIVLLTAVLCGSNQTCERAFRLLRWITNRPEPGSPANETTSNAGPFGATELGPMGRASSRSSRARR